MARKMKHKASRKNKGLKASARRKAAMSKPVGKKNKKANVRRREKQVPLGEAFRSREELQKTLASPDALEASMPGGPQGATEVIGVDPGTDSDIDVFLN